VSRDPAQGAAIRQAVSVALATGVYGISFGALAVVAGLSVWQTMTLSLVMFTGASQFALIGVIGAGGAGLAAVASAGFLGLRNGLYGLSLRPLLELPGPARLPAIQLTIDESNAVASAQPTRAAARTGFWWAGAGVYVVWNTCTLIGALAGDWLGDPRAWGLDAAAAAAFVGLLWPHLQSRQSLLAAAIAAAVALVLIPFTPAGVPVLAALAGAIVVGLRGSPARPAAAEPGEGP
jgi:predicted branched-subunit amino acid permease